LNIKNIIKYIVTILKNFLNQIFFLNPLQNLQKRQFKKHKNIITVSDSSKNDIVNYLGGDINFVKVIPNGVDTNRFVPSNISEKIRKKFGNNILLYSGLMVGRKRVSVLLEAMNFVIKEIPDVNLILTGKGPLLEYLKDFAISLKIQKNTTFLGFIDDDELLKYYASSDIFVFPSEKEGFGQVLLEAMASGTPVLCVNQLPMSEIVGKGGKTFKLNDPKDLSNKIIELLKDRNELNRLKANALEVARDYDWFKVAKIYNNYLKEIL